LLCNSDYWYIKGDRKRKLTAENARSAEKNKSKRRWIPAPSKAGFRSVHGPDFQHNRCRIPSKGRIFDFDFDFTGMTLKEMRIWLSM